MRMNLGRLAAASLLGGMMLASVSPASAQDWRDGRGIWHHGRYYVPAPQPRPRYAPPPPPAYVAVPVPVYGRPAYGNAGYYRRPVAYHRNCNSWWHWDRYRRGYVRVTNC